MEDEKQDNEDNKPFSELTLEEKVEAIAQSQQSLNNAVKQMAEGFNKLVETVNAHSKVLEAQAGQPSSEGQKPTGPLDNPDMITNLINAANSFLGRGKQISPMDNMAYNIVPEFMQGMMQQMVNGMSLNNRFTEAIIEKMVNNTAGEVASNVEKNVIKGVLTK